MKTLNANQKKVTLQYDDGEYKHVKNIEDAEGCGDTLFLFLLREAGDAGDDPAEFRRMLDTVIDQLQRLALHFPPETVPHHAV